jgi:hypothetical protein
MTQCRHFIVGIAMAALAMVLACISAPAQQPDEATVVRGVDAAVRARFEGIAGFTVTEHYAVFRGSDQTHPAAQITVKTSYRKELGKTYKILSQSGSGIIIRFGLNPLLDNEKRINDPGDREASWFTSANYEMKLKSSRPERIDGHNCLSLSITPKRKAPNLIIGTLWVDTSNYAILRIDGIASKRATIWSGPAHMVRDYAEFRGFSEATHAWAESDSTLFGRTVVTIDYSNYQIQFTGKQ